MTDETLSRRFIDTLYETIKSRRGDDPNESYTAQLFDGGVETIARKIGEESTEVIVAALRETPAHVVSESADLLYHLMVLWAEQDITPDDVFEELAGRAGTSGVEEKESR
ncbi:MAG: phosphoribosyl-ATP diphosphatase [Alphaproteobacteria bacterium]|jgi:phosphoribosyl-ATP pyrophosphohydrolase|nr:phosphoribosyl-ATP diphosphatase [Alphaproteobacteria bacterium]